jgi:hypothetical protein
LEPGGFARALLGQQDPDRVTPRATQSAAAFRAAMEALASPAEPRAAIQP